MTASHEREFLAAMQAKAARARFRSWWAERRRNLLDPNWKSQRKFPVWHEGMTTEQYVATFQALNRRPRSDEIGLTFTYPRASDG